MMYCVYIVYTVYCIYTIYVVYSICVFYVMTTQNTIYHVQLRIADANNCCLSIFEYELV